MEHNVEISGFFCHSRQCFWLTNQLRLQFEKGKNSLSLNEEKSLENITHTHSEKVIDF